MVRVDYNKMIASMVRVDYNKKITRCLWKKMRRLISGLMTRMVVANIKETMINPPISFRCPKLRPCNSLARGLPYIEIPGDRISKASPH